ncbi:carboxylesterase [Hahella sp. CCB-MM4]|uniref:alpha/beta hydrolase n=1 Tax=Hahella sp. (strain CCB-MM4) TaxID=1926491 RepID=UPI000B9A2E5A|nr:alpha/beta fold hydrolase [Hahella sp. CCB-MM4]OZG72247.1 carboxylesterase [Hahella sp. CCB-MM4]
MKLLPHIEVNPADPVRSTVIWLHGLGADGNDFAPVVPELQLPDELAVRFIFPHAPSLPVTVNGGYIMPAWYDILEMSIDRKIDTPQLLQSAQAIEAFIDREIERGIPSERIVLAGFSQGGAVAYQVAFGGRHMLAGVMGLSTYFATSETIHFTRQDPDFPILVCHGTLDPVVPEVLGQNACQQFSGRGFHPRYLTYPMEHQVCLEEIKDIGLWLREVLSFEI